MIIRDALKSFCPQPLYDNMYPDDMFTGHGFLSLMPHATGIFFNKLFAQQVLFIKVRLTTNLIRT